MHILTYVYGLNSNLSVNLTVLLFSIKFNIPKESTFLLDGFGVFLFALRKFFCTKEFWLWLFDVSADKTD